MPYEETDLADAPEPSGPHEWLSLNELAERLRTNNYHLNVVRYTNIASEVILMSAIKEGTKILKAVKHLLTENCPGADTCRPETRRSRSVLYAFKRFFDETVLLILETNQVDLTGDRHEVKIEFEELIGRVLELMSVASENSDPEAVTDAYRRLADELVPIPEVHRGSGDVPEAGIRFEEYYFTSPVSNVRKMFYFITDPDRI